MSQLTGTTERHAPLAANTCVSHHKGKSPGCLMLVRLMGRKYSLSGRVEAQCPTENNGFSRKLELLFEDQRKQTLFRDKCNANTQQDIQNIMLSNGVPRSTCASSSPSAPCLACSAKRCLWTIGLFNSVYALHTSLLQTNSSKRSVKPGRLRWVFASGDIISGWSMMNVGLIIVSSRK